MAPRSLGPIWRQMEHWLRPPAGGDGELLQRFLSASDQSAFELLVHRHGQTVWGVCRRVLGDEHEAEDAFQAAFLVLARRAGSIRRSQSLASWLHGVAYRVSQKARARVARRRQCEQEAVAEVAGASPEAAAALRELRQVLDEELARLPEKYRAPLVLCYLEGKTKDEAARALGWPEGTVSGRLARARDLLRDRLARRGLAFSTALLVSALSQAGAAAAPPTGLVAATSLAVSHGFSHTVADLGEGVVRDMFFQKLRMVVAVVLVLGVLGTAGSLAVHALASRSLSAQAVAAGPETPGPAVDRPGGGWQERCTLDGVQGGVNQLHFSPDGKRIIAQGNLNVRVWDSASREEVLTVEAPPGINGVQVYFASALTASRMLATVEHDEKVEEGFFLKLHDLATGKERVRQRLPQVQGVFSPDGQLLVFSSNQDDGRIIFWDVAKAEKRGSIQVYGAGQQAVPFQTETAPLTFSPDGKLFVLCTSNRTVDVWEVESGKKLANLRGHRGGVNAIGFSADGKTLITANLHPNAPWNEVKTWETATWKERTTLRGKKFAGAPAAVSPDARTMAIATVLPGKMEPQPGGLFINGPEQSVVKLYDLTNGDELATLGGHEGGITCLAFSPDGKLLATGSYDETVKVWALKAKAEK